MDPYNSLCDLARQHALVTSSASVLGWDQETYMPPAAVEWRARQLAWLSARAHEMATSDEWLDTLARAEEQDDGSDPTRSANLREFRYHCDRATKLPVELVARASKASSLSKQAWAEARRRSDFSLFRTHLDTMIGIAREKAEHWGYETEPYDALVAGYERGADTAKLSARLDPIREPLQEIAAAAVDAAEKRNARLPAGPYPKELQKTLNREIAETIGFNFEAGRIDTTTHPFCTGSGPRDTRLTTRYDEQDFTSSLFGVMHEAGHGLYDQGLPQDDFGLPSGAAVSLGIHESQSRLWENHVGGSRKFWEHWYPRACELFPQLRGFPLDDFIAAIRRAEFSPIRVDSDEATYDLHILLRFDIERRLVRGELGVDDVPAAWNERFAQSFGSAPADDAHGCLQDIHWSMGALGYFATYTLGNLNAAQLATAARADPAVKAGLDSANYLPLLDWMRSHVHSRGSVLLPGDLITEATGSPPDSSHHLEHLRRRYL